MRQGDAPEVKNPTYQVIADISIIATPGQICAIDLQTIMEILMWWKVL
jgi:hypothetical protein